MKYATMLALSLALLAGDAHAGGRGGRRGGYAPAYQAVGQPSYSYYAPAESPSVLVAAESAAPVWLPTATAASAGASDGDALAEVNQVRANRGLRPFVRDEGLTVAAESAAAFRAAHLIAGHTANDFAYLPSGTVATAAGCAAWTPDWGWGACCTYENWTYAGAAWCLGRDGRRYMHLYVR
jgi:hypothetical protein